MEQYINFEPIISIFKILEISTIADYFERLQEKVNNLKQSEWEEYYKCYFSILDTVIFYLQSEGVLSDESYRKISALKSDVEEILKEKFSIEIQPSIQDLLFLKAMDCLGIISWYAKEGKITFFTSPTLVAPLFRYISDIDVVRLRKHVTNVQKIKHPEMNEEQIERIVNENINFVNEFVERFKRGLLERVNEGILNLLNLRISTDLLEKIASVEFLPTSVDFYFAGIKYYSQKFRWKPPIHYTFSTTSGIIIPEEHYGNQYFTKILPVPGMQVDKNPVREKYFDTVYNFQQSKRRAYYFEIRRTSEKFKETYNALKEKDVRIAEQYKTHAIQILEKYLKLPNFSLIKVSEFPKVFDYLTLGNSRNVLISLRDKNQKIGHGIWIKPKRISLTINPMPYLIRGITELVCEVITGGRLRLEDLVKTFMSGFAFLIYSVIKEVRPIKQARNAIFDIREHIKGSKIEIEIIKDFGREESYIKPDKLVEQLLS